MNSLNMMTRQVVSVVCASLLLLFPGGPLLNAQQAPAPPPDQQAPDQPPPQGQTFSPQQLDSLVAPIALYPDALLSQVLVASTYPLELMEAGQWLQQNRNLQGSQLVSAAQQQNWDPSIQALVVFPDVIGRLTSNIRWTTDLGNAFLAQQADVMNSVQRLRSQAMAAGKLRSTPQETVTTQTQGGQTAIDIQPANPDTVYVPNYNPEYVWGPPPYGYYYPPLYYPAVGFGFGFWPGIYIGSFFGGLGWGGWGWGPNWFGGGIFLNFGFFNHYGFHGGWGGGFRGGAWAHNPAHRLGVPYSNRSVASRFGGNFGGRSGAGVGAANRQFGGQRSGASAGSSFNRANPGSNFGNGRSSSSAARPNSSFAQGSRGGSAFGGSNAYRSSPSYRSSPYGGAAGASRTMPTSRPSPGYSRGASGSSFRGSAGGFSGGGARSYGSSGGGGFRSSGGGGFHSSGGGGSHSSGGGGSHGGGGGSHGGGHR